MQHCWHTETHGGSFISHYSKKTLRLKVRLYESARTTTQRREQSSDQTMNMEQRKSEQQSIISGPSPGLFERRRMRREISVRHHRTFWCSSGPRGIDDQRTLIEAHVIEDALI